MHAREEIGFSPRGAVLAVSPPPHFMKPVATKVQDAFLRFGVFYAVNSANHVIYFGSLSNIVSDVIY